MGLPMGYTIKRSMRRATSERHIVDHPVDHPIGQPIGFLKPPPDILLYGLRDYATSRGTTDEKITGKPMECSASDGTSHMMLDVP